MTLESVPVAYSSVNSNLVYVAYDANAIDPVTYPNYKYVVELWISGNKVFTTRVFPHPVTGRGIVDFGEVIREYVIASLAPTGAGILAQELGVGEFNIDVVIKIREEYGGTVGAVVLTDSSRIYFNHYNGRYDNFTVLGGYVAKPLSVRPAKINLHLTQSKYYIPYFSETTAAFNVEIYGLTVEVETITPTAVNTLQLINIAPGALNVDYPGLIDGTLESYVVSINGVAYTVKLICPGMYENYYVHFINRFGGFESMLFNKVSRKMYEVEKKTWRQLPYRVNGSGVVSVKTGNIMHDQTSTFAAKYKEKLKISTDWLYDTEYVWLLDLVASPVVYLETGGTLYPVHITDTNYEIKENIVDGLQNLTLELDFGTTFKTQFR